MYVSLPREGRKEYHVEVMRWALVGVHLGCFALRFRVDEVQLRGPEPEV